MPAKKYPIEEYKHYTIYIVSGIKPTFYTAEKENPAKGITITDGDLDELKHRIDHVLNHAQTIHVNTYEGPDNFKTLQNPKIRIKSTAGEFINGLAVMIESDVNLDVFIEGLEKKPFRVSKKYRKSRNPLNMIKIVCRNCTVSQKG